MQTRESCSRESVRKAFVWTFMFSNANQSARTCSLLTSDPSDLDNNSKAFLKSEDVNKDGFFGIFFILRLSRVLKV